LKHQIVLQIDTPSQVSRPRSGQAIEEKMICEMTLGTAMNDAMDCRVDVLLEHLFRQQSFENVGIDQFDCPLH